MRPATGWMRQGDMCCNTLLGLRSGAASAAPIRTLGFPLAGAEPIAREDLEVVKPIPSD